MLHYSIIVLSSLVFGGGLWEFVKFVYPIIKDRSERKKTAYAFVAQSIDPILKAADELYGKLFSLSLEDFVLFTSSGASSSTDKEHSKRYICYLFAQFWAQMEYVRIQSRYSSVTSIRKGEELMRFIYTCETKKFRILDRSIQRIIGEAMIAGSNGVFKIMSLNDFIKRQKNEKSDFKKWILLLEEKLNDTTNKEIRQRILIYGIIAAAIIEHFDPEHKIVLRRRIYTNKLNHASRAFLKKELFGNHLSFVHNPSRYFS